MRPIGRRENFDDVCPIKVGEKVLVYGEIGEVQRAQPLGNGRYRYTIFFRDPPRIKDYTVPPTTIERLKGPLEQLRQGKLSPEIEFDLLNEAIRLSCLYEYERLVSLSSSRINLEPYQVFAVYQVIQRFPHRFLIADDTGLGKTIETGMILEELAARGRAERVLIVAPAPLCAQWQEEMARAFNRHYVVYDGIYLRQLSEKLPPELNPWEREQRIITSLDLAKRDEIRAQLERTRWDVVVFDEAHKLSARRYGGRVEETQRYRLARVLAERTDSLLLLSATPHNGDRFAFHALLALLDEYAFPSPEELSPQQVARVTIRRTKKEILDENGRPVFSDRKVQTLPVTFREDEQELYNAVTEYVTERYNLALAEKNRAAGFLMVLFQKRMVSSIEAIRCSLERRLRVLEELRSHPEKAQLLTERANLPWLDEYLRDPDSLCDEDREILEQELEKLPFFANLDLEIEELRALCERARSIKVDSKAEALISFLENMLKDPQVKVIVFTEYRDTLHYLERLAREKGWRYTLIHGGMSMLARKQSQREFERPGTQLLLATDAAGEGLNLHRRCHLMVNYELPWNPNRIEQRIGRLHRYGQKHDVKVFNLFVINTREDRILERLLERLAQIEADLPGDVHDVLGSLLEEVDLPALIMRALAEDEPPEVTAEQAIRAAEERARMLKHLEQDLLMDVRRYDHESALKLFRRAQKLSATSEDVRRFAEAFILAHGGKIKPVAPGIVRIEVPSLVQRRDVRAVYEHATFERAVARETRPEEVDFIAFGHPLFDAIVEYCQDLRHRGITTFKRVPSKEFAGHSGILCNFLLRFTDGNNQTARAVLCPVFVDASGEVRPEMCEQVSKFTQLRLSPPDPPASFQQLVHKLDMLYERALAFARSESARLEDQVQEERSRMAALMQKDLDHYAQVKEARLRERLLETQERIRGLHNKLRETTDEEDRNRIMRTLRLREYDLEQAERELDDLKRKVQRRREEIGNLEIIVDEEPELISLALVEFVPEEGG